MNERNVEEYVKNVEDLINSMNISEILTVNKNNNFESLSVEYYLQDKKKLLPFIKEGKRQQFVTMYTSFYKVVGNISDDIILKVLLEWELFGDILEFLNYNMELNIIVEKIHNQGHNIQSINRLVYNILYFSEYGIQFVEEVFGKEYGLKAEKEIDFEKYTFSSEFIIIPYEELKKIL